MTSLCGIGWRHAHYAALLEQRPPLGFIEVHSENFFGSGGAALNLLLQARTHYAVSLHGVGLSLGSARGIDAWHLDQLADLVERVQPVRVSDHACFALGDLPGGQTVHASDLLPIPFSFEALQLLCDNVQTVQERLKRPIAVENLSAYLDWPDAELAEPEFLQTLAKRTGCQLLVDVNNLVVNALNRGADPVIAATRWLDQIDPAHVAQIHLAGHHNRGDVVIDDHGCRVQTPTWDVFDHAVRRFGKVPSLVEWDTDVPEFEVLLAEAGTADQRLAAAWA